jgi:anti-anti-sigma factor
MAVSFPIVVRDTSGVMHAIPQYNVRVSHGGAVSTNPAFRRSDPFSVRVEEGADATTAYCTGPLIADHTDELKDTVKPRLTLGKHVKLDLSGVSFVDSAGLGALISLYTSARAAHCEFKLVNFNEQIRNLLHITNLLWLFE